MDAIQTGFPPGAVVLVRGLREGFGNTGTENGNLDGLLRHTFIYFY